MATTIILKACYVDVWGNVVMLEGAKGRAPDNLEASFTGSNYNTETYSLSNGKRKNSKCIT